MGLFVFLLIVSGLENLDTLWTASFGGSNEDHGYSVVESVDGGFIISGWTLSFGVSGYDFLMIRTDSEGNVEWIKTHGGKGYDDAYSILKCQDDRYIIAGVTDSYGSGDRDILVIEINGEGEVLMSKTYGSECWEGAYNIIDTPDGNFLITGFIDSTGMGDCNVYVVKIDNDGNLLWENVYGKGMNSTGRYSTPALDRGYLIAGTLSQTMGMQEDILIIKIDSSGNQEWVNSYGGADWENVREILKISDGYLVVGSTRSYGNGDYDVLLMKIDENGNELWFKTYGGTGIDMGTSLEKTDDGGIIITGKTRSFGLENYDLYIIKTDNKGEVQESFSAGGCGIETGEEIKKLYGGGYIVTGDKNENVYLARLGVESGVDEKSEREVFNLNSSPFIYNGMVKIEYRLMKSSPVKITLYDVFGRINFEVECGVQEKGIHIFKRELKDNSGEFLSRGIYFLQVKAGKKEMRRKLIVFR